MGSVARYDVGSEILRDLHLQPEMAGLLGETDLVTVNLRDHIDGGFDGEIGCFGDWGRFRHIRIRKMSPELQRGTLIFELTNQASEARFARIAVELRWGSFKTAEAYARANEEVEFQGVIRTLEIVRKINHRLGTKWVDVGFSNIPAKVIEEGDFETYYRCHLWEVHKNVYRKEWHKKMGVPLDDSSNKQMLFIAMSMIFVAISFWKFSSFLARKP
ncbi:MAG: hypothetical protein K1000chlam2_01395 [Chlamydiae bacterium]|nr:hypothetical protein [Chlamydiota bacterium]